MRIGILPALKRHDGGIYQYSVTMLNALYDLSTAADSPWNHEFVVFAHDPAEPILTRLRVRAETPSPYPLPQGGRGVLGCTLPDSHWTIKPFRPPWAPKPAIDLNEVPDPDSPQEQPDMRDWFRECGIDLMLFPSPHRLSFESGIPFVMAIHDLQHLLQPEFPEVSADGEWRRRESVLRNAAKSAALLIAESAIGREDILAAYGPYGVEPDRVHVLPYLYDATMDAQAARACLERVRERYGLPDRYLFYPAQFWPHKNHVRLVEALGLLRREHGLIIPLVLTGSGSGEIRERVVAEMESRCAALGIEGQVRTLGYVSDAEIAGLYAGAVALVMPTFFGPTNIPFLEAWSLGCPVLTSRIRGIVEQVGDAAVTVDPKSIEEMADGIRELWTNEPLRQTLIAKGRSRVRSYTPWDFRRRLSEIIDDVTERIGRERHREPAPAAGELRV